MNIKEKAKKEWAERKRFCLEKREQENHERACSLRKLVKDVLEVDVGVDGITAEIEGIEFGTYAADQQGVLTMHIKCDECGLSAWERVSSLSDVGHYLERMEDHKCPPKDLGQEKTLEERLTDILKELIAREKGDG